MESGKERDGGNPTKKVANGRGQGQSNYFNWMMMGGGGVRDYLNWLLEGGRFSDYLNWLVGGGTLMSCPFSSFFSQSIR